MIDPSSGVDSSLSTGESALLIEAVVVPLDGSDQGIRALQLAETLAQHLGCLVTTISFAPSTNTRQFETRIRRMARRVLASTPHSVMIRGAGPSVAEDIRDELALQPGALLCMPSNGRGGSAGLAGSVAATIVADLSGQVLIAGPACDATAFDPARSLLVVAGPHGPEEDTTRLARAWRTTFNSSESEITTAAAGLESREAARRLVDDAARTSAIVMPAWNGRLMVEVIGLAHCPVLVHR